MDMNKQCEDRTGAKCPWENMLLSRTTCFKAPLVSNTQHRLLTETELCCPSSGSWYPLVLDICGFIQLINLSACLIKCIFSFGVFFLQSGVFLFNLMYFQHTQLNQNDGVTYHGILWFCLQSVQGAGEEVPSCLLRNTAREQILKKPASTSSSHSHGWERCIIKQLSCSCQMSPFFKAVVLHVCSSRGPRTWSFPLSCICEVFFCDSVAAYCLYFVIWLVLFVSKM